MKKVVQTNQAGERTQCEGHPAGEFDPMGQTVYCDGSCNAPKTQKPTGCYWKNGINRLDVGTPEYVAEMDYEEVCREGHSRREIIEEAMRAHGRVTLFMNRSNDLRSACKNAAYRISLISGETDSDRQYLEIANRILTEAIAKSQA